MPSTPKVMISSTFIDLPEHRQKVIEACDRLGFGHVAMEHTSSSDRSTLENSLNMVAKSDVYVLVLGFRYGSIPQGEQESITALEFKRALELERPCLIFEMSRNHVVLPDHVETGPGAAKLSEFKSQVRNAQKTIAKFDNADQLTGLVIQALVEWRDTNSTRVPPEPDLATQIVFPTAPEQAAAHPYTLMQTSELIGREAELRQLDQWLNSEQTPLLVLHAIGGMGKSAATWKWFRSHDEKSDRRLHGSFWWSFYAERAGFDEFTVALLSYLTGQAPISLREVRYPQRLQQLRIALERRPILLVLDGFERELNAYARLDAARLDDGEDGEDDHAKKVTTVDWSRRGRNTFDSRVGDFLRDVISTTKAAKILVSSRIFPADLEGDTGSPLPGVISKELSGLSANESALLWRSLGVRGSSAALAQLFEAIQGYPLLVRAMAGQVSKFRDAPGNFDAWRAAHAQFNPYRLELKQRRSHILEYALRGIEPGPLQVLSSVAALRMPAHYKFLVAVLVGPNSLCQNEQLLIQALEDLEGRGLIGWNRTDNTYDMHPVVRSVVWTKVTTVDRERIQSTMRIVFEAMPQENAEQVKSEADLFVPIEMVRILLDRREFSHAYSVYQERLFTAFNRLGLYDLHRQILEPMFDGVGTTDSTAIYTELPKYQAQDASLHLGYVMRDAGDNATALKLMQYHNRLCSTKTCRLHQLGIFYDQGLRNTAEKMIHSLLQDIRATPDNYTLSNEFYCVSYLADFLSARKAHDISLAARTRAALLAKKIEAEGDIDAKRLSLFTLRSEYAADFDQGNYRSALKTASMLMELAQSTKNEVDLFSATVKRFYALLELEQLDDATADLRDLFDRARDLRGVGSSFRVGIAQAELLIKEERVDEGREVLKALKARLAEALDISDLAELNNLDGNAAIILGNLEEGCSLASEVLSLFANGDCPRGYRPIEWAHDVIAQHAPRLLSKFVFPPPVKWNTRLIAGPALH